MNTNHHHTPDSADLVGSVLKASARKLENTCRAHDQGLARDKNGGKNEGYRGKISRRMLLMKKQKVKVYCNEDYCLEALKSN